MLPETDVIGFEELETSDKSSGFEQARRRKSSKKRTIANGYKKYNCFDSSGKRVGGEYVNRGPAAAARKGANAMRRAGAKGKRIAVVQVSSGRNHGVRFEYTFTTKSVPASDFVRENSGNARMLQTVVKRV
jgi:hypothetical protein